jgi:hypothetical protein
VSGCVRPAPVTYGRPRLRRVHVRRTAAVRPPTSARDSGHGNFLVDGHDSRALMAVTDRDEVGPRSRAGQCRTLALGSGP